MVDGKQYTSNPVKLLQHLDKLAQIKESATRKNFVSPVMMHIAPTGVCNLECTYCCYANRDQGQILSLDKVKHAISQFGYLGVRGLEWTGGGDPSMWKGLGEAVEHASNLGIKQGWITNGLKSPYFTDWKQLEWTRLSFHAFNYLKDGEERLQKTVDKFRKDAPNTDVSGVYIWTHGSEQRLNQVVNFADRNKIPTRLTPDLTLGKESIDKMMPLVGEKLKRLDSQYVFLSDFNVKTDRAHDHCYMHMVKPFVFHDENVYVCPSAALSPDNHLNVNDKFKVCSIDDILETYMKGAGGMRNHDCTFCKYAPQNELVDDIVKDIKHKEFA